MSTRFSQVNGVVLLDLDSAVEKIGLAAPEEELDDIVLSFFLSNDRVPVNRLGSSGKSEWCGWVSRLYADQGKLKADLDIEGKVPGDIYSSSGSLIGYLTLNPHSNSISLDSVTMVAANPATGRPISITRGDFKAETLATWASRVEGVKIFQTGSYGPLKITRQDIDTIVNNFVLSPEPVWVSIWEDGDQKQCGLVAILRREGGSLVGDLDVLKEYADTINTKDGCYFEMPACNPLDGMALTRFCMARLPSKANAPEPAEEPKIRFREFL